MKTCKITDTLIQDYPLLKQKWESNKNIFLDVNISDDYLTKACEFLLSKQESFAFGILSELAERNSLDNETVKKIFIEGDTACKVAVCLRTDLSKGLKELCRTSEDRNVREHFEQMIARTPTPPKNKYCDGGEIFCIPLFLIKKEYDPKWKLKKEDENKQFAFGRVIGQEESILVEIFRITGPMTLGYESIVSSGLLFDPIQIFWAGIIKKRWKVIYKTPHYDKYKDSDYKSINIVLGGYDDMRLYNFESKMKKKLTREEARKYEMAIICHPIQLEQRIVQELKGKKYIHLDTLNWNE